MSIHPSAVVSPRARLGKGVVIGPFAVVEDDVAIGEACEIRAHAVIKRFTELGSHNTVHEGAVLGGEPQDVAFKGEDSRLVIGDRNLIREGVTIHRSTKPGGATVVGSDCFLMAYAHVAHDNRLGDRVIVANNVMLAGHVEIAERAFLGGGVGVHQFCRVGRHAFIGAHSVVVKDALPFARTVGNHARCYGQNTIGLRRRGFSDDEVRRISKAFRLLLAAKLNTTQALEVIKRELSGRPEIDYLVEFIETSERGVTK